MPMYMFTANCSKRHASKDSLDLS